MSEKKYDGLTRVAEDVGASLRARGETVALAESCTAGLAAAALAALPGASDFLWGGAVVYSEAAKIELVGLDPELLAAEGPVSEPTTRALADGIRRRAGADHGVAVTGWAGPSAPAGQDVGLVYIAVADAETAATHEWRFDGDRQAIRHRAAREALALLRRRLRVAEDGADE